VAAANRGAPAGLWPRALTLVGAIVVVLLALAATARAATITVTTAADDNTPNDGSVSLREAIQAINAGATTDTDILNQNPGTFGVNDTIVFNIAASKTRQTILVGSTGNGALPDLTRKMTIDGYSESGASTNTLANADNAAVEIALDGANAGPNADGILVAPTGAGSLIEGLDIFDFSANEIELQGGGDRITGNQLGYDNTGSPARSPLGIRVSNSNSSLIGGVTPAARNVISGNVGSGVDIVGSTASPATGNFVEGNFIGTDSTGVAADGNGRAGPFADLGAVQISGGDDNTIGGLFASARNVISGNGAGVDIRNGAQYNLVEGNFIGVGADGATAVPNINFGVRVASDDNLAPPLGPGQTNEPASQGNIIGLNPNNSFTGVGNVIANNGGDGVVVDGSVLPNNATPLANSGNSINGNSIYSNGGLGIDLKGGGGKILPDNLMTAPAITAISPATGSTVIQGALNRSASPMMSVRIELFASATCGPSGFGQGQTLIGSLNTVTNGSGSAFFTSSVTPLTPGQAVTATATNLTADPSSQPASDNVFNTSPFSACVTVPRPPPPTHPTLPAAKVTNVAESHRSWREGNLLAKFSRKRRPPVGTTFTFTLNEQAVVTFSFGQQLHGRNANGRCVVQTKRNRHKPSCTHTVSAGKLGFSGHSGLNRVVFQGPLSASRKLKPGSYTVTITASAAGGSSAPQSLSFTIVK
jgi:CSLREA domain-containing protein